MGEFVQFVKEGWTINMTRWANAQVGRFSLRNEYFANPLAEKQKQKWKPVSNC